MSEIETQSLVRIDITADTLVAAKLATEGICGLWLASPSPPRPVPGEGVRVTIHADISGRPEDGGFALPTCPHLGNG